MKFFRKTGIEFTYLPPKKYNPNSKNGLKQDLYDTIVNGKCNFINADLIQHQIKNKIKYNFLDVHNDCGVIEINSPICKTSKQMLDFYQVLDKIAQKHECTPYRDDKGSGGSHIHVEIPKNLTERELILYIENIYRDMANRPYLNYIFNEYCDDHTSNSTYNEYVHKNTLDDIISYQYRIGLSKNSIMDNYYESEPYCRINDNYQTTEFRIFNMVENKEDLIKHLKFIDKYVRYIYNKTMKGELIQNKILDSEGDWAYNETEYNNQYKNRAKTLREFKEFLNILGLDYKNYKKFYENNYLNRIRLGYELN